MAGLFGLFGSKDKDKDQSKANTNQTPRQKEAFYLNSDQAKTLGNVDFMRKSMTIRRTFPKTLSNSVTEVINQVSSMEKRKMSGINPQSSTTSSTNTQSEIKTTNFQPQRKKDADLEMFRNMAKNIGKK